MLKWEELDLYKCLEERKKAAKHHKVGKWILWNAAAIDPELPMPDELFDTCKHFFAQYNWAGANQELYHCFDKLGLEDVAWFKGTLKVLYKRKFIYMNPNSPSNFGPLLQRTSNHKEQLQLLTCPIPLPAEQRVGALGWQNPNFHQTDCLCLCWICDPLLTAGVHSRSLLHRFWTR